MLAHERAHLDCEKPCQHPVLPPGGHYADQLAADQLVVPAVLLLAHALELFGGDQVTDGHGVHSWVARWVPGRVR